VSQTEVRVDAADEAGDALPMDDALVRMMTPAVAAASVGNIAVTSLVGQLRVEHVDELERVFATHMQRWGTATVSITMVKGRVPLPDAETRARLQAMHAAGGTAENACVVLEGDGFWAAAARGVLASMALVSRKAPHATRTLDEALRWAAKRVPSDAPDVLAAAPAIAGFHERHLAQTASSTPPSTTAR
jgi:hypothetical protein